MSNQFYFFSSEEVMLTIERLISKHSNKSSVDNPFTKETSVTYLVFAISILKAPLKFFRFFVFKEQPVCGAPSAVGEAPSKAASLWFQTWNENR